MGYRAADGRWANTLDYTLHASAARTASGTGTAVEMGDRATLRLDLTVSAAAGTLPSLLVDIQTSADNSTWRTIGGFTPLVTTGTQRASFPGCDRFVRAIWTISGSAGQSFTFSVSGEGC